MLTYYVLSLGSGDGGEENQSLESENIDLVTSLLR